MNWNETMISDQSGKSVIITGSNTGIGYFMVKALASKGANVTMACRNLQKAERSKDRILTEFPNSSISTKKLDLADLSSIEKFATNFSNENNHLDVLINNAGVMIPPKSSTKDGFELQFGTNHLGHFALTGRLLQILNQTKNSRIITVSSVAHNAGRLDFKDLNGNNKKYRKWAFYSQSKIANW